MLSIVVNCVYMLWERHLTTCELIVIICTILYCEHITTSRILPSAYCIQYGYTSPSYSPFLAIGLYIGQTLIGEMEHGDSHITLPFCTYTVKAGSQYDAGPHDVLRCVALRCDAIRNCEHRTNNESRRTAP